MKGSTKLLIVAAALLVAGILLSAIGYGLGAMTLTWGEDGLTIDRKPAKVICRKLKKMKKYECAKTFTVMKL